MIDQNKLVDILFHELKTVFLLKKNFEKKNIDQIQENH